MAAAVRRIWTEPGLGEAKLSGKAGAGRRAIDWSAILPQWESLLYISGRGESAPVAAGDFQEV